MNGSSGTKRLNSPTLSSDPVANSWNTLSTFKKYGRDLSILNETVVSCADVLVEPHDMGDIRVQHSERVDVGRRVWSFPFLEPLPRIAPGTVNPAAMSSEAASSQAQIVFDGFNAALAHKDVDKLASCFYAEQAFWRDIIALTGLRGIAGTVEFSGNAHFAVMGPTMTNSPALGCSDKLLLLPVKSEGNGPVLRKIWVLSTWIETLSEQTEDETVLSSPDKSLVANTVNTDAFMAGAGSSGLEVAARLKALGVDSIVVDRNEHIGDNWTRRPGYRNARILAEQGVKMRYTRFTL
ncbi:putative FAD/NAD(P)-binding domain-containing protein [Seiridium unicorne]|uniref:FAD/NAD(P)-binding domain-containing protein n=1 Tax=Seiridium unicorne TaxID=138068 RepID=A0ABR2UQ38_9PEZI